MDGLDGIIRVLGHYTIGQNRCICLLCLSMYSVFHRWYVPLMDYLLLR